ncbi:hypothetical protein ACKWTF_015561 [Chironomus riparius]
MLVNKELTNSTNITGLHINNKTDDDVLKIVIESGTFSYFFPTKLCEKFKNLNQLDTMNSIIEVFDKNSFVSCSNLDQMLLTNSMDTEFPENLFFNNTKLTSLKLTCDSLQTVSKNILKYQFKTLKILEMHIYTGNFLLPWNFFNDFENLFYLKIEITGLKNLDPGWFSKLANLEELYILNSEILNLSKNIFSPVTNLRKLILQSNNLTIFHADSISGLNNLTVLDLMQNQILSLDPKIFKHPKLRIVNLADNFCGADGIMDLTSDRRLIRNYTDDCTVNYMLQAHT